MKITYFLLDLLTDEVDGEDGDAYTKPSKNVSRQVQKAINASFVHLITQILPEKNSKLSHFLWGDNNKFVFPSVAASKLLMTRNKIAGKCHRFFWSTTTNNINKITVISSFLPTVVTSHAPLVFFHQFRRKLSPAKSPLMNPAKKKIDLLIVVKERDPIYCQRCSRR